MITCFHKTKQKKSFTVTQTILWLFFLQVPVFTLQAAELEGDVQPPDVLQKLIEKVRSPNEVMGVLETAKASREAMNEIEKDLEKRFTKVTVGKWPAMTFKGSQLIINKKESGLNLTALEPLSLEHSTFTWKHDPEKSADQNYFRLLSELEGKQKVSPLFWFNLLIPQAHAFFATAMMGTLSGAALGALAGTVVGYATNSNLLNWAMAGGGIGAIVGAYVGNKNQKVRARKRREQWRQQYLIPQTAQ